MKFSEKINTRKCINNQCSKVSYQSKSLAKKALKKIIKSPIFNTKEKLNIYLCYKCFNYHVGNKRY